MQYFVRRFAMTVLAIFVIATITFIMMQAVPGDPFQNPKLTDTVRRQLTHQYGLDQPLYKQYLLYMGNVFQGDLGRSIETARPVNDTIRRGFPVSLIIGLEAMGYAIIGGLVLGIISALNRNQTWDYLSMIIAIIGISVPNFVIAALGQYFIGAELGWLPVRGWKGWAYHVMPALALGLGTLAVMARMMRTQMLEVINQDYIKTALAKGLSTGELVWRHEIRNAILPLITIIGPSLAAIVTGSFVIEIMFGIPGLGKYFVDSITARDYPMIMGTTLFYAILLITMNFLVDVAYGIVDPRIKLGSQGGS